MNDTISEFLCPRFIGKRFEQHGLPLELLKDFSVLDEMVKSVARMLYKKENAGKRLPRNFLEDYSLQITGLRNGSTIAIINLVPTNPILFPSIGQEYAEKARDCIVQSIENASIDMAKRGQQSLTQTQFAFFNRLWCDLREDESILFPIAGTGREAVFTCNVRRKLLEKSAIEKYCQSVSLYGVVSEVDQHKKTFTLDLVNGQRLSELQYDDELVEDIMEAFAKYKEKKKVQLQGIGVYSINGRLVSMESISDFRLLDDLDCGYRLEEIACLKDGWYDGKGKAFNRQQLQQLSELFQTNYSLDQEPYLYPTPDGMIQGEWDIGRWRVSLEIELSIMTGDYYALNLDTDEERHDVYNLMDGAQWERLCRCLGELGVSQHE